MPSSRRLQVLGLALTGALAAVTLTACSGLEYREYVCNDGEYPVLQVNGTGSACQQDGTEPPAGYARHPEGKVPEQVDDKWDVYWRTHTLDENGRIIKAP
ncbi:SCO0607 family lipoprotein [Streptomyces sp. NPDC058867]|uniref:SCO0607 family lipoprotein n=1 Tax=unclassified Streptomyces TaxID=2593676 RepID=UPI0036C1531A